MKYLRIISIALSVVLTTSCAEALKLVNYTLDEFQKAMPADSYDHTYIDAWQSGTGGKAMAGSALALDLLGGITGKDVSAAKESLHNATLQFNSDSTYRKSDVSNWFGALFTAGSELISVANKRDSLAIEERNREFEETFKKQVDDREAQQNDYLEANLSQACGITRKQYEQLSPEKRQLADLQMINKNSASKLEIPSGEPIKNIEEDIPVAQEMTLAQDAAIQAINNKQASDYAFGSSDISEEQKQVLLEIKEILKNNEKLRIVIYGHTCSIGSDEANNNVGLKRAEEAKKFLVELGISEDRISTLSKGKSSPIASNNTAEGRSKNRRITFEVQE